MVDIVQNVVDLGRYFTETAMVDPLSAILMAIGNLLIVVSLGIFGYLALRGILAPLLPDAGSSEPTQGH